MKAIIYTRVSTEEQAKKGVSLEMQLQKCRDFAKLKEHEIIQEFEDDGYSAKNLKRPALQKVLECIKSKSADILILYRLDRLSRDSLDQAQIIKLIQKKGVELMSVCETIDTTTPFGRAMAGMIGVWNQLERETIGQRVSDAMQHKKKNGEKYCHITPYGKKEIEGKLIINHEEQMVINIIDNLRNYHEESFQIIANELNQAKYATRSGKPWCWQSVKKIYENNS